MAPPVSPEDRFYGAFLMAVGGLIAGLCGACTLVSFWALVGLGGETGARDVSSYFGAAAFPLLVGGLPTLAGVFIFRAGFRRYRGGRNPDRRGMLD